MLDSNFVRNSVAWISRLLAKLINMQNAVKQTGLIIVQPQPEDYIAGAFSAIPDQIRVGDGNWKKYLPATEKQYGIGFDTLSCTSFSALNCIEAQINFLITEKIMSFDQYQRLFDLGYIKDGLFNASDRFTAITSGTTKLGNDFRTVWESIRVNGLLPEDDLPFGGTTFEEYHGANISNEMRAKAKKFLELFTIQYEWVFFDNNPDFETNALIATRKALLQAPVHIAIPLPSHHATMMYAIDPGVSFDTFDTYPPFLFNDLFSVPIHFALKGYVTPKIDEPFIFTKDLYLTKRDPEVAQLQKVLNKDPDTQVAKEGAGSPGNETVVFGKLTHDAVVRYQRKHGIRPMSGYVGAITRKVLNGSPDPVTAPRVSKIDAWCEAIKDHEGWYVPGQVDGYPDGSPSFRNNNPGNLRYVGQKRASGRTANGFCIFMTYDDGYTELKEMLIRACTGKSNHYNPEMSLLDFYEVYAPASDNNIPISYAKAVAKRIGVDITTQIKTLL